MLKFHHLPLPQEKNSVLFFVSFSGLSTNCTIFAKIPNYRIPSVKQFWSLLIRFKDKLSTYYFTQLSDRLIRELLIDNLTLQRGVTGTTRMLHALTHSSISRQVREQM